MIYPLIAIIVMIMGLAKGFRRGFFRQLHFFIGFCFGVVCAHLFGDPVDEFIRDLIPSLSTKTECSYVCDSIGRGLIFLFAYEIFSIVTSFLKILFKGKQSGILGSMIGMVFCALRYMLILSILFNWLLCLHPKGELLKYAKSDDGNIIEGVMLVAPAILGGDSVEDLALSLQLEDAKKIS